MRLLLDTHILLWLMNGEARLAANARALIDGADEAYFSSASIWEIAIKAQMGKIATDPAELVELTAKAGLLSLLVSNRHAVASGKLPLLHRDPFDRLLVAQAISEPMRLLTADAQLTAYSDLVIQV
jgi:PIN domain nuclease of toxin-antitoxin system